MRDVFSSGNKDAFISMSVTPYKLMSKTSVEQLDYLPAHLVIINLSLSLSLSLSLNSNSNPLIITIIPTN